MSSFFIELKNLKKNRRNGTQFDVYFNKLKPKEMKKRVIKLSILMAVLTIAMAGCKKDDELTASITPAPGWEKSGDTYREIARGTEASFILCTFEGEKPYTAEEYVTVFQINQKNINEFSEMEFSTTSNTKIGGRDAFDFTYTYTWTDLNIRNKERVIFISTGAKNKKIYSIMCGAKESDYDTVAADFQKMIDSYRLK